MVKKSQAVAALESLKHFIGESQHKCLLSLFRGEERQYFFDKIVALTETIQKMPTSYQTDGQGDSAVAVLHYFKGGLDYYITEKDLGSTDDPPDERGKQIQAFGVTNTGHGAELGYIDISTLIAHNVEIDLYWKPTALREIKKAS